MSTEELLKPRYKVIADYFYNPYKIGDIITVLYDDRSVHLTTTSYRDEFGETFDQANYFYPKRLNDFPHLFKPLQWWEDRKPENMPKYLTYKSSPDSNLYIIKVDRHFRNTFGLMNKVGCISDGEYYSYSKTFPSTEHEFLIWKAITHPNLLTVEERTKISEHKMTNEQVAKRISGLD